MRCVGPLVRCAVAALLLTPTAARGQAVPPTRVNILVAEDHRAFTPRDLAVLQLGARSRDGQTARLAVRALGRLERPSLIPAILPALDHPFPEIRAEAANALAQAAQGWKTANAAGGPATVASVLSSLAAALRDEQEPSVRAAISESIGRLPYRAADQVARSEDALLENARRTHSITDRLGVVKGLEALVRLQQELRPPGSRAIATLRLLAVRADGSVSDTTQAGSPADAPLIGELPARTAVDPLRDARVRRLALEALVEAGAIDTALLDQARADPDAQVRRLAVRGASLTGRDSNVVVAALEDPAAMVRLEAFRAIRRTTGSADEACPKLLSALSDPDAHVALLAIDELGGCGSQPDAVARLEAMLSDPAAAGSPRGWHHAAHAIVALAAAAPERAAPLMARCLASRVWQLRMYAARAAASLRNRPVLEALAADADDNVVEAAIDGLVTVAAHEADALYVAALTRPGYQAIRAAALALRGASDPAVAVPALKAALTRLIAEGRENSEAARTALSEALATLGAPKTSAALPANTRRVAPADDDIPTAAELRRLAAPRARVTIRGVGSFDLALFTSEAPATVLRFARLAESRYYAGLTFHRVVPNFAIQGGSPGANEYIGAASHMRDEVGLWPHVRGAVGISTRGRDTGDAQIFVDLVDNPRLDHEYTVFAQVLNGLDVVDRILEGDVIERIDIIP